MLNAQDFIATARFISATIERTRSLCAEQRHDDAKRQVLSLGALIRTIRSTELDHGFNAEILLGQELAAAESLIAEFA